MAKAQQACCTEVEVALSRTDADDFEAAVLRTFQREWYLQRGVGAPRRIAIVDDRPEEQYLYPEFILAQRLFLKHGIEAVITDAETLRYEAEQLLVRNEPIDLVYNRLVDFAFERLERDALRSAIKMALLSLRLIRAYTRSMRTSVKIYRFCPIRRHSAPAGFRPRW